MDRYIILLRGINVGGNNIIAMKDLRSLLETEGYAEVQSYIQSGNVTLCSENNPEQQIADLIEQNFGFRPHILVLTESQLIKALQHNPFTQGDGKNIHFFFCKTSPNQDLTQVQALATPSEDYRLIEQVFYLHAPEGIGRSKLAAKVERLLGVATTARNLNTVNKLKAMLE